MADPIDPRVTIGHVHLKVADLDRALAFYVGVLGFDVTSRMGDSAVFLSAGGYHHHIGLNTWESRNGPPPPPNATGLYHVAIRYPDRASRRHAARNAGRLTWRRGTLERYPRSTRAIANAPARAPPEPARRRARRVRDGSRQRQLQESPAAARDQRSILRLAASDLRDGRQDRRSDRFRGGRDRNRRPGDLRPG